MIESGSNPTANSSAGETAEGLLALQQRALEAATAGIVIVDLRQPGLPIVFSNPAIERMTHAHPQNLSQLLCKDRIALARRGEPCVTLLEDRDETGASRWSELSTSPICNEQGTVTHLVGALTDVTERRAASLELEHGIRSRTAELEAINADLEGFTYSVSHDLRGPMRAIMGFSRVLIEDFGSDVSPAMRQNLDRINAAAIRMTTIVDDLLAFSRLGRKEMIRRPINLSDMAHDIAADLLRRHPNSTTTIEMDEGLTAEGDPTLIHMALENLIDNAYKFTSKRLNGHVEFRQLEDHRFVVKDNGVGFDPAYSDKLFTPFERLHSMSEFPGTGIGLANVRRIIERHGGHVWAESAPDKGASFYFEISEGNMLDPFERVGKAFF